MPASSRSRRRCSHRTRRSRRFDRAARLAASRSFAADDELARLRRDAPQTQIGEGANDALLFSLARDVLSNWAPDAVPEEWRSLTADPPAD
jgi:hypothetical protein